MRARRSALPHFCRAALSHSIPEGGKRRLGKSDKAAHSSSLDLLPLFTRFHISIKDKCGRERGNLTSTVHMPRNLTRSPVGLEEKHSQRKICGSHKSTEVVML